MPTWRRPVPVAVTGIMVLLVIVVLAFNGPKIFRPGTAYKAEFGEAAGLTAGDLVSIAGVAAGRVDAVELAGDRVLVTFSVSDAWVGDRTSASIEIKTLLGSKYLALDPQGDAELDPAQAIPLARTASPFDVQAYGATQDEIVGRVAMPEALVKVVTAFIETHHVEETFRKRQRRPHLDEEVRQFGQEPVHVLRDRMRRAGRDPGNL